LARGFFGKQERRGGIETQVAQEIIRIAESKQERRGGIETPSTPTG